MSEMQFGRYVLMEPLGEGGQGRVFLARRVSDLIGGWPVVIKLAHESAIHDGKKRKRFFEEAERAIRLGGGPSIVGVTDVDVHDGVPYIVMEYDDGCDLRRVMWHYRKKEARPIPLPIACSILGDIAEGLHFAHFGREVGDGPLGLVHRDVKPANTLVTYRGYARLLDFGISTTRADDLTGQTRYGTPRYMSQDHFYCRVNPSMDVYSLAVVAWEMLEGRTFRDGQEGFSGDFPWAVINLEPPRMKREGLPADLIGLVEAGLAPSARPSAEEFMTVVRRYVQGDQERAQVKSMVQAVLGRRARTHHTRYFEVPDALRDDDAVAAKTTAPIGAPDGTGRDSVGDRNGSETASVGEPGDDEVTVARFSDLEVEMPTMIVRQAGAGQAEPDAPVLYRRNRDVSPVPTTLLPEDESAITVDTTLVLPSSDASVGGAVRSGSTETEVLPPPRATPVRVASLGADERAPTQVLERSEPNAGPAGQRMVLFVVVGMLVSFCGAVAVAFWMLRSGA